MKYDDALYACSNPNPPLRRNASSVSTHPTPPPVLALQLCLRYHSPMVPQWLIERKRDGGELTPGEISDLIAAYASGTLPDYQMSALAMAIFFKGMTFTEVTALTDAMMRSGDLLDMSDVGRPTADKHSTGGIGDKISLPLAPLVAACGVGVPMISGRGLGITGGTLDKLESIPGYNTQLSVDAFKQVIRDVGCSIIGQTTNLAPADKKLYALRDVTGTVPSIPLISASIMSKKLAEGAKALVLDVKFGSGAFMSTVEQARDLARTMVSIGSRMQRDMTALLTPMDQPLGTTVGNALEVMESIEILGGQGPADTTELTLQLGSAMLVGAGVSDSPAAAYATLDRALHDGSGLETFARMIAAHGGDPACTTDPTRLPHAPIIRDYPCKQTGYVQHVDARAVGRAALLLGAGRRRTDDTIDFAVGIDHLAKSGRHVDSGAPLLRLHARDEHSLADAITELDTAFTFADSAPSPTPIVFEQITQEAPAK